VRPVNACQYILFSVVVVVVAVNLRDKIKSATERKFYSNSSGHEFTDTSAML